MFSKIVINYFKITKYVNTSIKHDSENIKTEIIFNLTIQMQIVILFITKIWYNSKIKIFCIGKNDYFMHFKSNTIINVNSTIVIK